MEGIAAANDAGKKSPKFGLSPRILQKQRLENENDPKAELICNAIFKTFAQDIDLIKDNHIPFPDNFESQPAFLDDNEYNILLQLVKMHGSNLSSRFSKL